MVPAIRYVKAGNLLTATALLNQAIDQLQFSGTATFVLGCTELPLAYNDNEDSLHVFDATEALALSAVQWALSGNCKVTNAMTI